MIRYATVVLVALIIAGASAYLFLRDEGPRLILMGSCAEGVSGTIDVSGSSLVDNKTISTVNICRDGGSEIAGYRHGDDLTIGFSPDGSKRVELSLRYGDGIQSDQNNVYVLLALSLTAPFIRSDSI